MNHPLIAFCGSKGAGKSTAAVLFKKICQSPVQEFAIADELKNICAHVFGIDKIHFIDPALKEVEFDTYIVLGTTSLINVLLQFGVKEINIDFTNHIRPHIGKILTSPRTLLQYIGTEVLHPVDPLIHAKLMLSIKDAAPPSTTVVTDLRFINEFNFFKETLGDQFIPVYVKNSKVEVTSMADLHSSEQELKLFKNKCYLIENEWDLQKFEESLRDFANNYLRLK